MVITEPPPPSILLPSLLVIQWSFPGGRLEQPGDLDDEGSVGTRRELEEECGGGVPPGLPPLIHIECCKSGKVSGGWGIGDEGERRGMGLFNEEGPCVKTEKKGGREGGGGKERAWL